MGRLKYMNALAPFRIVSYRYQWPADLLTSWAFEMETLILGWYILVESGSVFLLTVFGSLQFVGTLIAPVIGVAADRMGRRSILLLTRAFYCCLAATLLMLVMLNMLTPLIVLSIAFLAGLLRPSDWSMRNALIGDTVPGSNLPAAMGLNRMTWDTARIAGALAGAGIFAALGMGPAYICITLLYIFGLLLTTRVGSPRPDWSVPEIPRARQSGRVEAWHELKEGAKFVYNSPAILALMILAFIVNLLAFPVTMGLLPHVAKEIYFVDQVGLGQLVAAFAAGSLIGSIYMTLIKTPARPGRFVTFSTIGWYLAIFLFSFQENMLLGIFFLLLAGALQNMAMLGLIVILLNVTPQSFRGRVMGVRMLAVYGLPLGLLGYGLLIELFGFFVAVMLGVLAATLLTACIVLHWKKELWMSP